MLDPSPIVGLISGMKVYDYLCLFPFYLSIRGILKQNFRNTWILFLAQASLVFYLFDCGFFIINAQLLSFSLLLLPISIDSYRGSASWSMGAPLERFDGVAHLITACMLVYQHPYESEEQRHLLFIIISAFTGFILGFTARAKAAQAEGRRRR